MLRANRPATRVLALVSLANAWGACALLLSLDELTAGPAAAGGTSTGLGGDAGAGGAAGGAGGVEGGTGGSTSGGGGSGGIFFHTIELQQGANDYAGTSSTYIEIGNPDTPAPEWHVLYVRWSDQQAQVKSLLRFELADLPLPVHVVSAHLSLLASPVNPANSQIIYLRACPVLEEWIATEATWKSAKDGVPWSTGGMADGVDYDCSDAADLAAVQAGSVQLDVTAATKQWLETDGAANHGMVVLAGCSDSGCGNVGYQIASETASETVARPKLVVTYYE